MLLITNNKCHMGSLQWLYCRLLSTHGYYKCISTVRHIHLNHSLISAYIRTSRPYHVSFSSSDLTVHSSNYCVQWNWIITLHVTNQLWFLMQNMSSDIVLCSQVAFPFYRMGIFPIIYPHRRKKQSGYTFTHPIKGESQGKSGLSIH